MLPGVAIAAIVAAGGAQFSRILVPWKYRDVFDQVGQETGIDPVLLHAIALHESLLNPDAIGRPNTNGTRDYGLFQINETNFAKVGLAVSDDSWRDPLKSARAAAKILLANQAEAKAHGQELGFFDQVAAYNAGLSSLHPGRPKLDAKGAYINQAYVRDVTSWYGVVILASFAPLQKLS